MEAWVIVNENGPFARNSRSHLLSWDAKCMSMLLDDPDLRLMFIIFETDSWVWKGLMAKEFCDLRQICDPT